MDRPPTFAALPPLYAAWLLDALGGAIPAESHATCDDCAMCDPAAGAGPPAPGFFDVVTRCCTHLPVLPNFLVGRILADAELDAGRASVIARIEAGLGVIPLGLTRPPADELLHRHGQVHGFGRSRALRCPHHRDDGGCGIWRHRNAACATWFCKHERGAVAMIFWRDAIQNLLQAVERELAEHCILRVGLEAPALLRLLPPPRSPGTPGERLDEHDLDGRRDPDAHRALWGRWAGRELEFFAACAAEIGPLTWSEVRAICGPRVRLLETVARHAYAELLADEVPAALRLGELAIIRAVDGRVRLRTYSDYDPLELPRVVVDALAVFDGRPTSEACAEIAESHGIELGARLLRRLVDFRVLVPDP